MSVRSQKGSVEFMYFIVLHGRGRASLLGHSLGHDVPLGTQHFGFGPYVVRQMCNKEMNKEKQVIKSHVPTDHKALDVHYGITITIVTGSINFESVSDTTLCTSSLPNNVPSHFPSCTQTAKRDQLCKGSAEEYM